MQQNVTILRSLKGQQEEKQTNKHAHNPVEKWAKGMN